MSCEKGEIVSLRLLGKRDVFYQRDEQLVLLLDGGTEIDVRTERFAARQPVKTTRMIGYLDAWCETTAEAVVESFDRALQHPNRHHIIAIGVDAALLFETQPVDFFEKTSYMGRWLFWLCSYLMWLWDALCEIMRADVSSVPYSMLKLNRRALDRIVKVALLLSQDSTVFMALDVCSLQNEQLEVLVGAKIWRYSVKFKVIASQEDQAEYEQSLMDRCDTYHILISMINQNCTTIKN